MFGKWYVRLVSKLASHLFVGYEKPDLLVQPHPPREPSTDRLRRRIRVKNGSSGANKDRVSSAGSLKGSENCYALLSSYSLRWKQKLDQYFRIESVFSLRSIMIKVWKSGTWVWNHRVFNGEHHQCRSEEKYTSVIFTCSSINLNDFIIL